MRTLPPIIFSCLLLSNVALAAPTTQAGDPAGSGMVGNYGDLRRIDIEGAAQITAERVREALQSDPGLQVTSGPAAPIGEFISTLKVDLLAAYLSSGFPFATVDLKLDPAGNPTTIVIFEGNRYRCGTVRVEGTKTLDPDALVKRLTTPHKAAHFKTVLDAKKRTVAIGEFEPPTGTSIESSAPWKSGDAAAFDPISRSLLDRRIAHAMSELGYFHARFTTDLTPADNRQGNLLIKIEDEGPRATLGAIDVDGALRNEVDAVTALLDLRTGQPIDLQRLLQVQQTLWESGRFTRHVLSVEPHPNGSGAVRLRIDLTEHPDLPKLTEPLTDADRILLKTRQWLEAFGTSDDELSVQVDGLHRQFELIVTPRQGFAVRLSGSKTETNPTGELAILIRTGEATFFSPAVGSQLIMPLPKAGLAATVTYLPSFESAGGKKWRGLNIGAGFSSKMPGHGPLAVHTAVAPVVMLDAAHDRAAKVDLRDGVLTIARKDEQCRIDADTGRIIEIAFPIGRIRFDRGVLAALTERLQKATPQKRQLDREQVPQQVVEAILGGVTRIPGFGGELDAAKRERAIRPLARLLVAAATPVAGRLAPKSAGENTDRFAVPLDPAALQQAGPIASFAVLMLPWLDELAPRGSWPWTIARETCLLYAGVRGSAGRELGRLHQDEATGPIALLALASSPLGNPTDVRVTLARGGLRTLTAEAAVNDLRFLWQDEHTVPAQITASVVREIRRLDPADVQAIAEVAPQSWRGPLIDFAAAVRAAPSDSPADAIPPAVKKTWDEHLRPMVESSLRALIPPPPPPPRPRNRGGL